MSIRTVIISLIIAIALGGSAWYLLSRSPQPVTPDTVAPGALLIDVQPAAIRTIRIVAPDGSEQAVERGETPGTWLALLNAGRPNERRWPIQPSAAQGLLRRIAEARAIAVPAPEDVVAGIGPGPTLVIIELDDRSTRTLRFAARTLGERGLVSIESSAGGAASLPGSKPIMAVADSSLHRVFREPGPKGWRETRVLSAFPAGPVGPDISRLRLTNVDRSMTIGKVGGSWAVIDPVAADASPDSVRTLLNLLGELSIEQFFDDQTPPADTTGLNAPIVSITIESDRLVPATGNTPPTSSTDSRQLFIGKPSDGSLERRYASFGPGPVFTITSTALTQELFVPTRYIVPRALSTPAGDIGGVILEPAVASVPTASPTPPPADVPPFPARIYKRSLQKWVQIVGSTETPLDDLDAKTVEELLSFFSGEAPASIELAEPAGWTPRGEISLLTLSSGPLSTLSIGSTPDGALAARTTDAMRRSVYRVYSPGRSPALLSGLAAALKRDADTRPKATGEPDIMK